MTEVYFRGEYIEKSYRDLLLQREQNPGTPEYEDRLKREAEAKAQADEEKKKQQQLQKEKKAESKLKEQKIDEYLRQYKQEFPGEWSDSFTAKQLERAHNRYNYELDHEKRLKEHAEEQRQMEESNKRHREQREREAIARRELPERQLKMFLSGNHTYREPGLKLLAKEYRTGEIIKRIAGQEAYNWLVEFGKPGEAWEDLFMRLRRIVEKTKTAEKNGLTIY